MLTKLVNTNEEKCMLVKEFLFYSTCYMRDGNLLKMCVSEICVKRISVNQGLGVKCEYNLFKWKIWMLHNKMVHPILPLKTSNVGILSTDV